ncbi:hypothetical protein [Rhizobium sp. NLR22b]|uniref:hypothetical protein n=1 Tax=Rhizobium sp. NLR22b TaxID=2731115 RepID=UPI001C82FBC9|nr:hypothetical protein [Rhizobium sp. NLR22b]MBX5242046.1 hypothetical protein [Rhizobium sp. NLR22b]
MGSGEGCQGAITYIKSEGEDQIALPPSPVSCNTDLWPANAGLSHQTTSSQTRGPDGLKLVTETEYQEYFHDLMRRYKQDKRNLVPDSLPSLNSTIIFLRTGQATENLKGGGEEWAKRDTSRSSIYINERWRQIEMILISKRFIEHDKAIGSGKVQLMWLTNFLSTALTTPAWNSKHDKRWLGLSWTSRDPFVLSVIDGADRLDLSFSKRMSYVAPSGESTQRTFYANAANVYIGELDIKPPCGSSIFFGWSGCIVSKPEAPLLKYTQCACLPPFRIIQETLGHWKLLNHEEWQVIYEWLVFGFNLCLRFKAVTKFNLLLARKDGDLKKAFPSVDNASLRWQELDLGE